MEQLKSEFKSDLFELNTLKLYLDGTVELATALMEDPYCAPANGSGAQLIDYESMQVGQQWGMSLQGLITQAIK